MDIKTKINIVVSILLVALIGSLAYWAQLPSTDLQVAKAQVVDTDTVLVRIQDFAFDLDVVRIEPGATVSWLHDETEGNAGVQHTVTSLDLKDPDDPNSNEKLFDSGLMSLGDTFSYTFDDEGVFNYNCTLHPFMTGKVCVGAASEALDPDCAIDETAAEGVAGEEEPTLELAEPTDALEEALEDALADALAEEEAAAEEELFPASDEEFEVPPLPDAEGPPTTPPTEQPPTTPLTEQPPTTPPTISAVQLTEQVPVGDEIADAGPEDLIYLLMVGISFFAARRIVGFSKR